MKEKSFAQELAELINRHGIDAKMNTNDWILADVAVDALNAYGKANQLREKMANAPETKPGFCRLYVRENKRLAMYRKSRKFAPWLKDNRRDIESIG